MAVAPILPVPALRDLCVRAVAEGFPAAPTFGSLRAREVSAVVRELSLDLPFHVALPLISDEDYWRRRAAARWRGSLVVASHGQSWKQLYVERHLQEALETYDAASSSLADLQRLLWFCARHVSGLHLRALPSHLDAQLLLGPLDPGIARLALCYGGRALGMDYERALLGMSLADCRCLARALARAETLVVLDLANNCIDDDRARMLASGLVDNITLTQLNLAHNRLSDRGARAIARLLDGNSVLTVLDLSDNALHADAGRALGRSLSSSNSLLSLNVRLNRLGDEGCAALCAALARTHASASDRGLTGSSDTAAASSSTKCGPAAAAAAAAAAQGQSQGKPTDRSCCAPLERLHLGANGAGPDLVPMLAAMLRANGTLSHLDVSGNDLGTAAGAELRAAVGASPCLKTFEVRGCGLDAASEAGITEELLARAERRERRRWLTSVGAPPCG